MSGYPTSLPPSPAMTPPDPEPKAAKPATPRRAALHRKVQRLVGFGWKGWVLMARSAAPWALLAFALVQIKTLTGKVRDVQEREFSEVQSEVEAVRVDLVRLRSGV